MQVCKDDPQRLTRSADERYDTDWLVAALVDNVVFDPEDVHNVMTCETLGNNPKKEVEVTFNNVVGPTVAVDGVLEKLNMLNWRTFCDKFLTVLLKSVDEDPDGYEWPTPIPAVTFVPEEDGTDVITQVRVRWTVDDKTWNAVKSYVEAKAQKLIDENGEETCCNCDVQIKYKSKKGKTVVVCPECGEIQPICSECERPEHGEACNDCAILVQCRAMNKMKAEWR